MTSYVAVELTRSDIRLIPLPPLDGSWILSRFLPAEARANYENLRRYGMLIVVGFIMAVRYTPVGGFFFGLIGAVMSPFNLIVNTLAHLGG